MSAPEPSRCDLCQSPLGADQLVVIGGQTVCAACKPTLLLNLKSGVGAPARISPLEAGRIKRRITALNLLSFLFALPGIGLQVLLGTGVQPAGARMLHPGLPLLPLVGFPLIILGLMCYARMKGRHWAWGFLGLLSCVGLGILHFLPKSCQHCQKRASYRAGTCGDCGAPV